MTKKSDRPRVLVCGGRRFNGYELVFRVLDRLQPELVITGGASGADRIAGDWASQRNRPLAIFPAHWSTGRSAGPIRNEWMLRFGAPDLVLAFPGGRGTADMVRRAESAGVQVVRFVDDPTPTGGPS